MTKNDIIRMAREAGFDVVGDLYGEDTIIAKLTKLVELEREACAKVCEDAYLSQRTALFAAGLIRARGQG